jgi:hypothetical protein
MGAVTTAFVRQYNDTIAMLVQQKMTKLRGSVLVDTDFTGEYKFYDQLGATEMIEKTSRHQDTPIIDPDHNRRRLGKQDFIHNTLFDKEDQLAMLIDPKSKYMLAATMAAGRKMDDVIITGMGGTAYSGVAGATSVAFGNGLTDDNTIAAGGAGLTKAKILQAKKMLDEQEVDDDDRFLVCSAEQIEDLLNTTEVASSDYNSVKALVEGQIDTWIGFKFIRSERLDTDDSDNRLVYAYHKAAIQLGIQKEANGRIDERPDKNYAWQVFMSMSIGATRLEEERIVKILCAE